MYVRYHTPRREAPPQVALPSKHKVARGGSCMNCGRCVDACIFGVHERDPRDPRLMSEPRSHLCKGCLRCVESCPQRALSVQQSPEFLSLGGGIWTPARVHTIWNEAWTGRIPVFGAGYKGRFAGPGYDSMWTDMSEIVRPTRDGIHGREFISTSVELGRRMDHLEFDAYGRLLTIMPPTMEVPLPMLLDVGRIGPLATPKLTGLVRAAEELGTMLIAPAGMGMPEVEGARHCLVPVLPAGGGDAPLATEPRMLELEWSRDLSSDLKEARARFPQALVGVRLPAGKGVEDRALELVSWQVDVIHVLYDEQGTEPEGRHARDSLLSINRALTNACRREEVSILASGGMAAAEHVPKSLICGADAVALERALMVALGCHACTVCEPGSCPMPAEASAGWTRWRVLNLVGAWRDQLLEVMGAMGMREARRLRGETGRAIFYEDAEREAFSGIQEDG